MSNVPSLLYGDFSDEISYMSSSCNCSQSNNSKNINVNINVNVNNTNSELWYYIKIPEEYAGSALNNLIAILQAINYNYMMLFSLSSTQLVLL